MREDGTQCDGILGKKAIFLREKRVLCTNSHSRKLNWICYPPNQTSSQPATTAREPLDKCPRYLIEAHVGVTLR